MSFAELLTLPLSRPPAGGIIHLVAADTKVIKNTVQGARFYLGPYFTEPHRMHNELALYTRKPLCSKGYSLFVTVKGVERPVFI